MDNETIARKLTDYAEELDREGASVYRARAFRRAAEVVRGESAPLARLVEEKGRKGLEELPGIGPSLAFTIDALVRTGEFRTLRPVNEMQEPDRQLTSLPGVGPFLARRLADELGVHTLEDLERAAREGKLASVGIGAKRLKSLQEALAERLQEVRSTEPLKGEPTVEELLVVDEEYRRHVEAHELPMVTPRRFNPDRDRWLPIFRTEREGWRYRALFSNTALAHRLGTTRDWVVIYFEDGTHSGQRTIVTEGRGDLSGRRVVRGRERECRLHYLALTPSPFGPEPAA